MATSPTRPPVLLADRPPARAGDPVHAIETPALIVDLDAFDANCDRLATRAAAWPHVRLRPHAKAHKTPQLASRMARLLGPSAFAGLAVQKTGEAEAMAAAFAPGGGGVPPAATLLLTNEVVCPARLGRLAALAASLPGRVGLAVDSEAGVAAAAAAASAAATRLGVVIDCEAGQARCGVPDPPAAAALARSVLAHPASLALWGVQAYHGGIQHVRARREREAAVRGVAARAAAAAAAVREVVVAAGPSAASSTTPFLITGGGTGTWALDAAAGVLTEVQPGSFCFGDADYGANEEGLASGGGGDGGGEEHAWAQALWVLTQTMSVAPGRAVVDAGSKAVDTGSGPPRPAGRAAGLAYAGAGDEHGVLTVVAGGGGGGHHPPVPTPPADGGATAAAWGGSGSAAAAAAALPPLGAKVWLQPSHCDPTVNLYDWIVGVKGGVVEGVWRVAGRGPGV